MAKYIVTKGMFQGHKFSGQVSNTYILDPKLNRKFRPDSCVRIISEEELLECATHHLDLCRPNPDKTQDYAERMGMEWIEESNEWLDMEGIYNRILKYQGRRYSKDIS